MLLGTWQPIDLTPKDGTPILAGQPGHIPMVVAWANDGWRPCRDDGWANACYRDEWDWQIQYEPSQFIPVTALVQAGCS